MTLEERINYHFLRTENDIGYFLNCYHNVKSEIEILRSIFPQEFDESSLKRFEISGMRLDEFHKALVRLRNRMRAMYLYYDGWCSNIYE
jgi:hypothetical protein